MTKTVISNEDRKFYGAVCRKKVGNNSKENSRKRFCLVVAVPPDAVEFGVLQAPW